MIIDTHAHLTDPSLAEQIDTVVTEAAAAGVSGMLAVATDLATSEQCLALAERYPAIRASVGIHPNYCAQAGEHDFDHIRQLARQQQVVAIGETGLDRHWDDSPWEMQLASFRAHIELSRQVDRPLIIHTRDCAEEMLQELQDAARSDPLRGVMHSFTGPQSVADGCLALGLYISFAGMLTYKNAADLREIAKRIPIERLLVETDCPYLTPHPFRGQRPNRPALVVHTLDCLAQAQGLSRAEMANITTRNAHTLFAWQRPEARS